MAKQDVGADGVGDKTVWDWLQLLIVPVILTIGGFWFTAEQEERQQDLENARAEAEQRLEDQRARSTESYRMNVRSRPCCNRTSIRWERCCSTET